MKKLGLIALVLLFGMHLGMATNIVMTVKSELDKTVTLSWNTETNGIYQIESCETLDPLSNSQVRWTARELEFPAYGTNTVWMDVGDPGWVPRLFHPRLGSTRFYRVSKVGTATLTNSPLVTISLYQGGNTFVGTNQTTVSNFVEVRYNVDLGNSEDLLSEVLILVDGQVIERGYSTNGATWINTTEWTNGVHQIWAVAKTVDSGDTTGTDEDTSEAAEYGIGVSQKRSITFDNYISEFFVATSYFQPSVQGVQEIVAKFKEDSYWRLFVVDGDWYQVLVYQGEGESLYVPWDGTDFATNQVPDGVYNYYIEARPKTLGPLGGGNFAANQSTSSTSSTAQMDGIAVFSSQFAVQNQVAPYLPIVQFEGGQRFTVPQEDASPVSIAPPSKDNEMSLNSFSSSNPPMPPLPPGASGSEQQTNEATTFNDPTPPGGDDPPEPSNSPPSYERLTEPVYPDFNEGTEVTYSPIRILGLMFKGFAGVFGTAYQGNHPSWKDVGFFSMPTGGSGWTSTWAPYGPLKNVSAISKSFGNRMTAFGWRRSFELADNSFQWFHLTGCYTGTCANQYNPPALFGGHFARASELGLLIGHSVAANNSAFSAATSYYPFWNGFTNSLSGTWRSYDWIALPQMDFGQSTSTIGGYAPLKWMAFYGCNSLRINDVNDQWTKFLLPMPPNLRVLLGADTTIYIVPEFGSTFADSLNGVGNNGVPMTVIQSWYAAGTRAHQIAGSTRNPLKRPGTVRLTAVYRAGSPGTAGDTIWGYPSGVDNDYLMIYWQQQQVYP